MLTRLRAYASHAIWKTGLRPRYLARTDLSGFDLWHDIAVVLGRPTRPLLIDVGANRGQTVWAMRRTFRDARVIAFEPSPRNLAKLRANYGDDPAVTIEPMAVGDQAATTTLNMDWFHSANDSLLRAPSWDADGFDKTIETVQVDVCTIDDYCVSRAITSVDVLKIDAQGYDLHVLRGAARLLAARIIRVVTAEVNTSALYVGQPKMSDLLAYMDGVGYRLLGAYEPVYIEGALLCLNLCWVAS